MPSERDKTKRWRPWQFGVRNLLLATITIGTTVGMGVRLQVERRRLDLQVEQRRLDQSIREIQEELGGGWVYEFHVHDEILVWPPELP